MEMCRHTAIEVERPERLWWTKTNQGGELLTSAFFGLNGSKLLGGGYLNTC